MAPSDSRSLLAEPGLRSCSEQRPSPLLQPHLPEPELPGLAASPAPGGGSSRHGTPIPAPPACSWAPVQSSRPACLLLSFPTLLPLPMPCLPHSCCPSPPATTVPPSIPLHPCPSVPASILFIPIPPTLSLHPHPSHSMPTPCPTFTPSPAPPLPDPHNNPQILRGRKCKGKRGTPSLIKTMALGDMGLSGHLCWWGDKHTMSPNHSYTRPFPWPPQLTCAMLCAELSLNGPEPPPPLSELLLLFPGTWSQQVPVPRANVPPLPSPLCAASGEEPPTSCGRQTHDAARTGGACRGEMH